MKLKRAIEITEDSMRGVEAFDDPAQATALKLLIQAGKRVIHVRTLHTPNPLDVLPGETKE